MSEGFLVLGRRQVSYQRVLPVQNNMAVPDREGAVIHHQKQVAIISLARRDMSFGREKARSIKTSFCTQRMNILSADDNLTDE